MTDYAVRFSGRQPDEPATSLEEARARIRERADTDEDPDRIWPASIVEMTGDSRTVPGRVIEQYTSREELD